MIIPKTDKEVRRLPSGFPADPICIPNFVAASDRIRIENPGDDGVSFEKKDFVVKLKKNQGMHQFNNVSCKWPATYVWERIHQPSNLA